MARVSIMAVAIVCYFGFFASFVYLVGFVGGFDFMPTHVDKGIAATPTVAVLVDLALIAMFGIQHSVMARQSFKRGWTKIVPPSLERSIFCLATALVLGIFFYFWHPIAGSLWSIDSELGRTIMWGLFWAGWAILFIATWLLNHFELFGLQQAWQHMTGREPAPPTMRTPLFYRHVRHPIYTGFFIALWATPDMSWSHFVLAAGLTIYILIGIAHEERDLIDVFGEEYRAYRRRVGSILPGIGKRA